MHIDSCCTQWTCELRAIVEIGLYLLVDPSPLSLSDQIF